MPRKSKINITLLSELSGVSTATISRILNRKGVVKESTRRKVFNILSELDGGDEFIKKFEPAEGNLILSVIVNQQNLLVAPYTDGISACAAQNGHTVLQLNCGNNALDTARIKEVLRQLPVAGLLINHVTNDEAFIEEVASRHPVVVGFEKYHSDAVSCVCIDDYLAIKNAVDFLISRGRRKIAFLNADLAMPFTLRRERGYREALENAGISVNEKYIAHIHVTSFNFNIAEDAARTILNMEDRPDAFVAITDTFAAAILKVAHSMNLSVPEDLAIIGFDNTEVSSITSPTITTVNQPSYQIGYQACDILINKIRDPMTMSSQITVNHEFIIREST